MLTAWVIGVSNHPTHIPPIVETVVAQEMTLMQEAEFHPREFTPDELREIVRSVQEKHGLGEDFYETAECESSGFIDQKIQSGYYHNGVRETSFGIFQFNLPSGLKTAKGEIITYEIAVDPYKAAEAAAFNFKEGNAHQWTCWHKRTDP